MTNEQQAQQEMRAYGELMAHRENVKLEGKLAVITLTVSAALTALTIIAIQLV